MRYLARSPIYSHLSSSIQGVPLIRSYETQQMCIKEFSQYLDKRNQVDSVMFGVNRWMGIRSDVMVAAFVCFLTFSALIIHRSMFLDQIFILNFSFAD